METKLPAAISKIMLDTATFENTGVIIEPTYINFFFGANGVGKSTLAEAIESDTGIQWQKGVSREQYDVLVYNQEFIERNFSNYDNLAGVFSINERNIEVQEQIEAKIKRKIEIESDSAALKDTTDSADAAWDNATNKFRDLCWDRSKSIRDKFDAVIAGKKNKKLIGDAILAVPSPAKHNETELKALYDIAFDLNSRPYHVFTLISTAANHGTLPGCELMGRSITSSSDTPFAEFLKAMNATDWVLQGHNHYETPAGGICPYCQQPLPNSFSEDIASCFDAQYQQNIDDIKEFQVIYARETDALIISLKDNLQDVLPSVDLTKYIDKLALLESNVQVNHQRIKDKAKEPSSVVALEDIDSLLIEIDQVISEINRQIVTNNSIVNDKRKKQEQCKRDVWALIAFLLKDAIDDYKAAENTHKTSEDYYTKEVARLRGEFRDVMMEITDLNKLGINTEESIANINHFLRDSCFQGFKLRAKAGAKNTYEVVRENGRVAKKLSEGERNFIAFLYFYQLVRGNGKADSKITYGSLETTPEGTDTRDKIVVIDDPVSSMDSNAMFLVGSIVREMISVCYNNTEYRDQEIKGDYVKQFFILTHNAFFHRLVTYKEVPHYRSTSFYMIRKADNRSNICLCVRSGRVANTKENYNPVQNAYAALWEELKRLYVEENASIPIKNVSHRILDYYFIQLCGLNGKDMRNDVLVKNKPKFVKEEGVAPDYTKYHMADALLQYITQPTGIGDEIFISDDCLDVELHKEVFKSIFESLDQDQHYKMMMGEVD